jgi:hypothetical protein
VEEVSVVPKSSISDIRGVRRRFPPRIFVSCSGGPKNAGPDGVRRRITAKIWRCAEPGGIIEGARISA